MIVQEQTAVITSGETEVSKLRAQVSQLTELNVQCKDGDTRCCFTATSPDILTAIAQTYVRSEDTSRVEDQTTLQGIAGREIAEGCRKGQQASGSYHQKHIV